MKKKWLSLFIFCLMCLFCFNAKASASTEITSQVKSGKTTYYVSGNSLNKIYKKTSGKDKVVVKKGTDDYISLICAYKNYLYFTVTSGGDNYSASLVKYGIKTKKTTVIKKVKNADAAFLYNKGIIYIHFFPGKYSNAIYTYNCKTNKYKKFVKIDKNNEGDLFLGVYDNYIYFYNDYRQNGKEYTKLMKLGIKNKKVSTVKKFNQLVSFWYYKGYIAVNYGWIECNRIIDETGFDVYNCKKKSFYTVNKQSTGARAIGGKWYYVAEDSEKNIYLMKCDLNGKNPKKLKKLSKKFDFIDVITKNSITYYDYEEKAHTVKF